MIGHGVIRLGREKVKNACFWVALITPLTDYGHLVSDIYRSGSMALIRFLRVTKIIDFISPQCLAVVWQ
jgi:hypothetical protein